MTSRFGIFAAIALLLIAQRGVAMSGYHVGNSLTNNLRVDWLNQWSGGYTAGRHVNEGASLKQIWDFAQPQFSLPPYAGFATALKNYNWDVLTLEPYTDSVSVAAATIEDFREYTTSDPQIYVYQVWPKYTWPFSETWNNGYPANKFSRGYYSALMSQLPANTKMIPTGEVLYEINRRIEAGTFPATLEQLFINDSCKCHLSYYGQYALATTVFATVFETSPVGLPVPEAMDPSFVQATQRIAWQVVAGHRFSGVAATGDFDGDGNVTFADYERWRLNYTRGIADVAGYTAWRDALQSSSTAVGVPEPQSLGLLLSGSVILVAARKTARPANR